MFKTNSLVVGPRKSLDDDRQLVFNDVEVAWHGCEGKTKSFIVNNSSKSVYFLLKSQVLTSDVLHGDGAGGGQFAGHPEGFVTQLFINAGTFEQIPK